MSERKSGRAHGEVFTENRVVQYILDEVGYKSDINLKDVSILEPSSGHGAFGVAILKRLYESSKKFNFSFIDALQSNVRFNELNLETYDTLRFKLGQVIQSLGFDKDAIESVCMNKDFLKTIAEDKYDCIVGNPPYIRHELISDKDKILYKSRFGTFKNRADLYIPFFEHSLNLLSKNGKLSFICSNRWLYNQYGNQLRELISRHFDLKKILNIEKSSPFDESVIAYPCITTIKNAPNSGVVYYFESNEKDIDFEHLEFEEIQSPITSSWQNIFLRYNLDHEALLGITEQGFKIGIGVATGADAIFLVQGDDDHNIEKSRLLPIITARDLSKNTMNWKGKYVINPYENDKLCDLEKYPNLKNYLNQNKPTLLKRHVAQKSSDKWYQTIDKITPEIKDKAKILLPDLTGNKFIFIDEGQFYPHHNIYYITGQDVNTLKILACILMSTFVQQQLGQIGIRMNGGLPRFQSQVLRKIKVPNINLIGAEGKLNLIKAYDQMNFDAINSIIDLFCLTHEVHVTNSESANQKVISAELTLF